MNNIISLKEYISNKNNHLKGKHESKIDHSAFLKSFIDNKESEIETVHVIEERGYYLVKNQKGKSVNDDFCNVKINALVEYDISPEDYLLNVLINIAPQKIIFNINNVFIERKLRQVFGDRLYSKYNSGEKVVKLNTSFFKY
ncbi:MAG: sporulation protein YtxC [bacterium]